MSSLAFVRSREREEFTSGFGGDVSGLGCFLEEVQFEATLMTDMISTAGVGERAERIAEKSHETEKAECAR